MASSIHRKPTSVTRWVALKASRDRFPVEYMGKSSLSTIELAIIMSIPKAAAMNSASDAKSPGGYGNDDAPSLAVVPKMTLT